MGSNICCFWMALKFHCKLKNAQIAKYVLMRSIYLLGVCLPFSLTNLLQTLPLGLQFLLCFSTGSSNMKCFLDKDSIWGTECLSLLSLFFMCLECAGMYVNTFQSPNSLFFSSLSWTCHCLTASFQFLLEFYKFQQDFFPFFFGER